MSTFTQLDFLCRKLSDAGINVSISNDGYWDGKNQPIASIIDGDSYCNITYNKKGKKPFYILYGKINQPIWETTMVEFRTIGETFNFITNLKK